MNKFHTMKIIRHVKTNSYYRITSSPIQNKILEHNGETYYEYRSLRDGITWLRCKSEMEDGRFELIGDYHEEA